MILLIEDNPRLSKNISQFLQLEKFSVETARDGKIGLKKALTGKFSLILLDLNLPLLDGTQVCKAIREAGKTTPIIILTARDDTEDKVKGLDIGADDYMVKPFHFSELLARMRALFRRESEQKSEFITIGNVTINFSQHSVLRDKKQISLSPKEFAVLEFLVRNRKSINNRTEILEAVWGREEERLFHSDTVEVHISYLRKKLGKDIIQTFRGIGYKILS